MIDRHEGMFALLSYAFICYYTYKTVQSEGKASVILKLLVTGSAVVFIIGVFQSLGLDLFKSDIGKRLILGSSYSLLKDSINFVTTSNAIYSTLFHYNYVGTYVSILLPLLGILTLFTRERKWQVIYGGILFLGVIVLFNSFARSGFIAVAFAVFVATLLFIKKIFSNKKNSIIIGIAVIVTLLLIGYFARTAISYRISNTLGKLKSIANDFATKENISQNMPLKDLKVSEQEVTIVRMKNLSE